MKKFLLTSALSLLSIILYAQNISLQGVLRDENRRTVDDGVYEVTFRLYDQSSGGTAIWTDTYNDLQIRHGLFQVNLGEQTSLDGIAFDTTYFVGVQVEGFNEMSPRIQLTIYPYAKAILGQENKFPSVGNVELERDSIVVKQGALKFEGPDGAIVFNDGTRLNTAEFGDSASSLLNSSTITINADKDGGTGGNISFQTQGTQVAQISNAGDFFIENGVAVINSDQFYNLFLEGSDSIGTAILMNNDISNDWELSAAGPNNIFSENSFYIYDRGAGANRLSILDNGFVGLTNPNPVTPLHVGVDDIGGPSTFRLSGGAIGVEGAEIQLLMSGDHDDVNDYWYIDVFEDDLRFGAGRQFTIGNTGIMTYTGSDFNLGLFDITRSVLRLAGDNDFGGGAIEFYNGANWDTNSEYWYISTSTDDLHFGQANGGLRFWLSETGNGIFHQNLYVNGGYLEVGVPDLTSGLIDLRGSDTGDFGGHSKWWATDVHNGSVTNWYAIAFQDDFRIGGSGTSAPGDVITINPLGYVGIGTSNPTRAKVEIAGGPTLSNGAYAFYARNGGNGAVFTGTASDTDLFSIYATGRIGASEFNAFSDKRIKSVIGISEGDDDLNLINQIEITDYTLIDKASKGNKRYKKVIAQQVEEIFPQAVSLTEDFIPSVYESATTVTVKENIHTVSTKKAHGFTIGEKIKVIGSKPFETEVTNVIDSHTFEISLDQPETELFVYGKYVTDFRTVDYEAISMLNVSATQELSKQLDEQKAKVAKLEKENDLLKAKLDKVDELEAKLNALLQQSDAQTATVQASK
jgi:hypothetical protein